MYETLSENYDRFVNWPDRLAFEMPFIRQQVALLQIEPGESLSILDSACGTGMHAIALAKEGHRVGAADLFPQMIGKARQNAAAAGVQVEFAAAGFGELEKTFGASRFDLLLCLGNSLPHILTAPDLDAALVDFASCLRPGGRLLIQNRNFDAVVPRQERWMEPQVFQEPGAEWIFQRFYDFLPDGLIRFNVVMLKREGGDWQSEVTSTFLRPQLKAELVVALGRAGFTHITAFGSMKGDPFDESSSGNLVLTAELN